jgi:hypothetical protein
VLQAQCARWRRRAACPVRCNARGGSSCCPAAKRLAALRRLTARQNQFARQPRPAEAVRQDPRDVFARQNLAQSTRN